MKINKVCPKCGGTDIVKLISDLYDEPNLDLGLFVGGIVRISKYICCDCGFKEEWAEDEDLPKLRKRLGRIRW